MELNYIKAGLNDEQRPVITVTGNIGENVRAEDLINFLRYFGAEDILIEIFSFGGDAFHALAIYDFITTNGVKVEARIYGLCGSAATIISCAAQKAGIGENSFFFIHNAFNRFTGEADETAQQVSERFVEIYAKKTKLDRRRIRRMMKDGDETQAVIGAKEALELGFVDKILKEQTSIAAMMGRVLVAPDDASAEAGIDKPPFQQNTNMSTNSFSLVALAKKLFGTSAEAIKTEEEAQAFLEKQETPAPATGADVEALNAVKQEASDAKAAVDTLRQEVTNQLNALVEQVTNLTSAVAEQAQTSQAQATQAAAEENAFQKSITTLAEQINLLKGLKSGQQQTQQTAAQTNVTGANEKLPEGVIVSTKADEVFNRIVGKVKAN